MTTLALQVDSITKTFGSFCANNNVCFTLKQGEVLAVLGENGAGKSTLMNVLCGLYKPDGGSIDICGERVTTYSPARAMQMGVGMVHQHFMLIQNMTGYENIILGAGNSHPKFMNRESLKEEIDALTTRYGLEVNLDKPISSMSVGEQQRIEILKVLWRGSEILILDEPTAVLTPEETDELIKIVKNLAKEGRSIIFISHKLRETIEISDRVLVMREGNVVAERETKGVNEQELANLMIGRHVPQTRFAPIAEKGDVVVEIERVNYNLSERHHRLNDISLKIHAGEIVGIAGVDGNGQSELAKLITGLIKPDSGKLALKGEELVGLYDPMTLIKKEVSHIPEDRNKMGLVGEMSIEENLLVKSLHLGDLLVCNGLLIKKKQLSQYAQKMIDEYNIACTGEKQPVGRLSGGNQQKVILAREITQNPDVLVAVHATRGLDIGAAAFVHEEIAKIRDKGCAVLYISTDLPEILKVSDLIAVMSEGEIMGFYDGRNPDIDAIALAMAGKRSGDIAE